jgi:hypothetical protein
MSLAPVQMNQLLPTPLPQQRRHEYGTSEQRITSADTWERQWQAELEGSLTYQLVRRILMKDGVAATDDVDVTQSASEQHVSETITVDLTIEIKFEIAIELQAEQNSVVQKGDPLVLDLNGDGITSSGMSHAVSFDLTADGALEQMSHVTGDNYFLAVDWNRNQQIDSGHELFGDQGGASNGFEALKPYDDNRDGIIDASDRLFSALTLVQWQNNHTQRQMTLSEAGIRQLNLRYEQVQHVLGSGDLIAQKGTFVRNDGSSALLADVMLQYR